MSDRHDEKAAELLPCDGTCWALGGGHGYWCPVQHRPAVAAALRAEEDATAARIAALRDARSVQLGRAKRLGSLLRLFANALNDCPCCVYLRGTAPHTHERDCPAAREMGWPREGS